jgi:phosphate transport system substrate-binding protein
LFIATVQKPGARRGMRSRMGVLGLALLLGAWGSGCQKPAETSSLVYAGSGSIGYTVLSPLSEGFVQRGGRPVEASS